MKLSRKSDYALRALFTLAEHYGEGPISIRELAEKNDIPRRFLEQIMIELRERKWVKSIAGRDGGFVLGAEPGSITMGQVVRHFDGLIAPISCVSVSHYEPCSQEPFCRFRRVLLDVRNYSAKLMDEATLAMTLRQQPVTHEEVFSADFIGGDGI